MSGDDLDLNAAEKILQPRRRPAQQRSRAKYSRILAAARSVLVDMGFESFTFDEVAKRAEVPIGTLYQFFANKYVLICELDREDTADTVAELQRFADQVPALQWPDILDELIDHLADMWRGGAAPGGAARATAAATEQPVLALLAEVLRPLAPNASRNERLTIAGLLVHTMVSLLNYSVHDEHMTDHMFHATVDEIKRMLIAYLFAVATS